MKTFIRLSILVLFHKSICLAGKGAEEEQIRPRADLSATVHSSLQYIAGSVKRVEDFVQFLDLFEQLYRERANVVGYGL